jgi:hypothetical protein
MAKVKESIRTHRPARTRKRSKGQQVGYLRVGSLDRNEVRQLEGLALDKTLQSFRQGCEAAPTGGQIADPKKVASMLDFSIGSKAQYLADGPLKLQERLVKEAQVAARAVTQRMTLPEVLISATAIGAEVSAALKTYESITSLGVEIMSVAVISIKPTPEMAKALEAGAREGLQRKSDEAIYARRNAAVEQERRIKESELNTELAVEEKKRQIREAQIAAEIAIEEQRALLMDQKVANERKDADSRAYAMEATAKAIETTDWKKLMLISPGGFDAGQMIALAFQELAGNAQKIGELNISPDLLQGLMSKKRS